MPSPTTNPGRVWYPYTQMRDLTPPIPILRGQGAWLEATDGTRYLDAISSWWVTLHGHAEPRIAAAVAAKGARLEQVILSGYTHPAAEELAERLVAITPAGLNHVFYSDDGSTAVEVALKMAWQSWQQRGQPRRRRILGFEHAYHGDTLGAMAVSAPSPFTAAFADVLFPVEHLALEAEVVAARLAALEGEVAAVIIEPLLQGAGGMLMHSPEFLRQLRQLCDRHQVLLIADEVLTGFGRTGSMFACEQAGIAPDILCLSKGLTGGFLPLAATLATDAVYEAFLSDDRRATLFHGHSFTGNALGCAAALASLDIFASEPVFDRMAAIARHHQLRLTRLASHPRVRAPRQLGTVAALDLATGGEAGYLADAGPRLRQFFTARHLLLRPLGATVYVLPPYCITPDELDQVWDGIEAACDELS